MERERDGHVKDGEEEECRGCKEESDFRGNLSLFTSVLISHQAHSFPFTARARLANTNHRLITGRHRSEVCEGLCVCVFDR